MKDFENMTTLENSYCKPQNEAEWSDLTALKGLQLLSEVSFENLNKYLVQNRFVGFSLIGGNIDFVKQSKDRSEIPVQHFIDLLEDRIVPWRLEEIGLKCVTPMITVKQYEIDLLTIVVTDNSALVGIQSHFDSFGIKHLDNIKTFTDLLTLIKFLE